MRSKTDYEDKSLAPRIAGPPPAPVPGGAARPGALPLAPGRPPDDGEAVAAHDQARPFMHAHAHVHRSSVVTVHEHEHTHGARERAPGGHRAGDHHQLLELPEDESR